MQIRKRCFLFAHTNAAQDLLNIFMLAEFREKSP